ncbi:chorismate-binding protein [Yimella sp. cx-51]|uniref:chorismate-binding protein n=1 Tax=Yimella sp. cx-51 TaxID=2770551 RepID=UPI001FCB7B6B|nr:chorismate-binding protein [Yimella sp. cx-51]
MAGQVRFGAVRAHHVAEVRHDLDALDEPGFWTVVGDFEGRLTAVRMEHVERDVRDQPSTDHAALELRSDDLSSWTTSLDRTAYCAAVEDVRQRIARGEVYQVNVCRVLSRLVPQCFSISDLGDALVAGNPAPYGALIELPEAGLAIACASPELYLARDGSRLESRPIKGTAGTAGSMLVKDTTENVMITDLVRNDLSRVSEPGTVSVDALCAPEDHPGLSHLVSTVSSRLRSDVSWAEVWAATFPPGSVSGAPKSTALQAIRDLETMDRGPYCGAIGYVDNDFGVARLAVGIRTFWLERAAEETVLKFGTGAGITWGSDPLGEWEETELKARRLVSIAESVLRRQTPARHDGHRT